jgi:uncharacterized damage-inducible protein DinB
MMMSREWLSASARYNRWMNDKLYGLAGTLSDEARKRDAGAFFKSIHGTFNHLLLADRVWLARFNWVTVSTEFMGPGGIRALDQELYSDFEDLRRQRAIALSRSTASSTRAGAADAAECSTEPRGSTRFRRLMRRRSSCRAQFTAIEPTQVENRLSPRKSGSPVQAAVKACNATSSARPGSSVSRRASP